MNDLGSGPSEAFADDQIALVMRIVPTEVTDAQTGQRARVAGGAGSIDERHLNTTNCCRHVWICQQKPAYIPDAAQRKSTAVVQFRVKSLTSQF